MFKKGLGMKIDRLIGIIMELNNKSKVTARELSGRFEVSVKTIQRDIDTIDKAGIPIVSYKGQDGGYSIIDSYKVSNTSMTVGEAQLVKSLLEGLNKTYKNTEAENLIRKIGVITDNRNKSSIIVDFNGWGKSKILTNKINNINIAINNKSIIAFDYINLNGTNSYRKVEPYNIVFKALNWYLYGYCLLRNEMRIFKLTRIKQLEILCESFEDRQISYELSNEASDIDYTELILKVNTKLKAMLEDSFSEYQLISEDKEFIKIKVNLPYNNWIYSMLLSFGDKVEVLEPLKIKEELIIRIKNMSNLYK